MVSSDVEHRLIMIWQEHPRERIATLEIASLLNCVERVHQSFLTEIKHRSGDT